MIQNKPLSEIVWSDIEAIALARTPEGPQMEFKAGRLLQPDPGQTEVSKKKRDDARDALAKEICAFANTYGGMIIVAIDDEDNAATGVSPVPDVSATARRIEDALLSVLDPPIGGLELTTVERPGGDGAVVVRVPASMAAPHGFGFPPAVYIRRGDRSVPMTMRDLQSVFWDARTRRERVKEIRQEQRDRLAGLRTRHNLEKVPGFFARISAIAHAPLPVRDLGIEALKHARPNKTGDFAAAFGSGPFFNSLRLAAGGLESVDSLPAIWRLHNDGLVGVVGFRPATMKDEVPMVSPGWLATSAMMVVVMMEKIRRQLGQPGLPYEIDADIWNDDAIKAYDRDRWMMDDVPLAHVYSTIGPFIVGSSQEAEPAFRALEEGIWNSYGIGVGQKVEFPDVLAP